MVALLKLVGKWVQLGLVPIGVKSVGRPMNVHKFEISATNESESK